ncbi:hypothetical protein [Stenotrophomonas maltophilia]|uniref:hypothetical protein n=1 Tax=Stenotrophomonas maltophilia TaxID=40324 RepID=UPI00050A14D1|nr:hypothetical protein [Stenotrophomonas maltophilia]KGM22223.1 hypothetical protein LI87_0117860 [Stenotrophomonas maltophilia]
MSIRFSLICAAAIVAVVASYVYAFAFHFKLPVSGDPSHWGALGDYVGGILNPGLSFASILLIIRTIQLQRESNDVLRAELDTTRRESKLRALDGKLQLLIAAQSEELKNFKLSFKLADGTMNIRNGVAAILYLEELILDCLEKGGSPNFELLLEHLDFEDSLLGALRRFYIPLRTIVQDLSGSNGFSEGIRDQYVENLIGLTNFSLLRVVMLSARHLNSAPAEYIRNSPDLERALVSMQFSNWPTPTPSPF